MINRKQKTRVIWDKLFKFEVKIANNRLIKYLRISVAKYQIKKIKIREVEQLVDFAFSFSSFGINIKPTQVRQEIIELLTILRQRRLKTIIEIGTENGGTLFLFSRIALANATLVSVDLPEGSFGGGYPDWKTSIFKTFQQKNQKINLIRADSHLFSTYMRVQKILKGKKIDFLFIDGDHTYEGVKKDFNTYSPLVKKGGIIAFHDIVSGPIENVGGVPSFWSETKQYYNYIEIVADWNQGGFGIGVIFV